MEQEKRIPGIDPSKPIMHVVVDTKQAHSSIDLAVRFVQALQYGFGQVYNIITSPGTVSISTDLNNVLQLNVHHDTNYDELLETIKKFGDEHQPAKEDHHD